MYRVVGSIETSTRCVSHLSNKYQLSRSDFIEYTVVCCPKWREGYFPPQPTNAGSA